MADGKMKGKLNYEDFLESKKTRIQESGFEVKSLNPKLFDFQEWIVRKALKLGKFAIFADCGQDFYVT